MILLFVHVFVTMSAVSIGAKPAKVTIINIVSINHNCI